MRKYLVKKIISVCVVLFLSASAGAWENDLQNYFSDELLEEITPEMVEQVHKLKERGEPVVQLKHQVPAEQLKTLSTRTLIDLFLNNPDICLIGAYSNLDIGLKEFRKRYNGLDEILNRTDSGIAVLKVYQELNLSEVDQMIFEGQDEVTIGKRLVDLMHLELLLAQESLVKQIIKNNDSFLRTLEVCLNKYETKVANLDVYGLFGLTSTGILLDKLLSSYAGEVNQEEKFGTYVAADPVSIEALNNLVKTAENVLSKNRN